jgi:hypothetical protein
MDDARDAEDATRELDGTRLCGKRVKVIMILRGIIVMTHDPSHWLLTFSISVFQPFNNK